MSETQRFEIAIAAGQFFGSTRAASILPSRPLNLAVAVLRPVKAGRVFARPPEGLGLDWPEHGDRLDRIGTAGAGYIGVKFKPLALMRIQAAGNKPIEHPRIRANVDQDRLRAF